MNKKKKLDIKQSKSDLAELEREFAQECREKVTILKNDAIEAIRNLHDLIVNSGTIEAANALCDVASFISGALDYQLKYVHESQPGFTAVARAAADSMLWPAMIPAMEEMRPQAAEESAPPMLGANLPVRVEKRKGKGKTRSFMNEEQTGFAFNVYCSLEARRPANGLEEFSKESLAAWVKAGLELVFSRRDLFPETKNMKAAIKKRISKVGQAEKPAIKHVTEKMLKAGFKQLLWR